MKYISLIAFGMMVVAISCKPTVNSETEDTATQLPPSPAPERLQQPVSQKYCYYTPNDTAVLTLEIAGSEATGTYMTHLMGKDKSSGVLEGVISNDTIVANYRYLTNGTEAIREVVFVVRNNTVTEGKGGTTLQNGKEVISDRAALTFDESRAMKVDYCDDSSSGN